MEIATYTEQIKDLHNRGEELYRYLDVETKKERLEEVNLELENLNLPPKSVKKNRFWMALLIQLII